MVWVLPQYVPCFRGMVEKTGHFIGFEPIIMTIECLRLRLTGKIVRGEAVLP